MKSLFGSLLIFSALVAASVAPVAAGIDGQYDKIDTIPQEHSLDQVVFEEFLNFSCPHCNNFRTVAKPLFDKFGTRIKRIYIPILFRGQADYPLRLFFIAQAEDKEEIVKNALFDAAFKFNANVYDKAVVAFLARRAGIYERFQKEGDSDWVTEKIQWARALTSKAGVTGTPTVVLQHSMRVSPNRGMQEFVNNLDSMIEQLLK